MAQRILELEYMASDKTLSEVLTAGKIEYGFGTMGSSWFTKKDKMIDDLLKEIEVYKEQLHHFKNKDKTVV